MTSKQQQVESLSSEVSGKDRIERRTSRSVIDTDSPEEVGQ